MVEVKDVYKMSILRSSSLNKILVLIFVLIFPILAYAGFPEGETGYELKKIEQSFKLPCSETVSYTHLTLPTNREV